MEKVKANKCNLSHVCNFFGPTLVYDLDAFFVALLLV